MEGEHTPTIIRLIPSTDLVIIQLEDSPLYSSIPTVITFYQFFIQFPSNVEEKVSLIILVACVKLNCDFFLSSSLSCPLILKLTRPNVIYISC